jgi:hypothetical protein
MSPEEPCRLCSCETYRENVSIDDLVIQGPDARSSDPETSHEAAAAQTPRKNGPLHAAVLLLLYWENGLTDEDLSDKLGGPESSPRKRRGELQEAGLVEAVGKAKSRFGHSMIVWDLTDLGHEYVKDNVRELVELRDRRKVKG